MQEENNIFPLPIPKPIHTDLEEKLFDIAEILNDASADVLIAAKCASRCDFDHSFRDRVCRKLEALITRLQSDVEGLVQNKSNIIPFPCIKAEFSVIETEEPAKKGA